jgi:spore coat polysaccharide biosynthesis protein SpsF (cytidylyltransferase family)
VSRVLVGIQARLGSTRLPGKVLEQIGPCSALEHVYRRAEAALPDAHVVVLYPSPDTEIRAHCSAQGMEYYCYDGDEDDVFGRYIAAVQHVDADVVVRLTADCPFVTPEEIQTVAGRVMRGEARFATNVDSPRYVPDGYDVEAFSCGLLREIREHLPGSVLMGGRVHHVMPEPGSPKYELGRLRWTLDTPADLAKMRALAETVDVTPPNRPTCWDLLAFDKARA